jgi:hypothetical protein
MRGGLLFLIYAFMLNLFFLDFYIKIYRNDFYN